MIGYGCGILGGGWFGMMFIPLILTGIAIYAIFKLTSNGNVRSGREFNNSIDILNERFARGEISEEEYKQKKALLSRY